MTYHGVVLLLSGYQADEARIIREYEGVVRGIEARYPKGALWILNRVCAVLYIFLVLLNHRHRPKFFE